MISASATAVIGRAFRQYDKIMRDIWETHHLTESAFKAVHEQLRQKKLLPFPKPSLGNGSVKVFGENDLYGAISHIRSHANPSRALVFAVSATEDFLSLVISRVVKDEPHRILSTAQLTAGPNPEVFERARNRLFRGSVVSLLQETDYQLGFNGIFVSQFNRRIAQYIEINARRNIWMHNAGKVDSHYKRQVPGSSFKIGDRATMTPAYIREAVVVLRGISAVGAAEICRGVYNDPVKGGKIRRRAEGFAP